MINTKNAFEIFASSLFIIQNLSFIILHYNFFAVYEVYHKNVNKSTVLIELVPIDEQEFV